MSKTTVNEVAEVSKINSMTKAVMDKYINPLKARLETLINQGKSKISACSLANVSKR